MWRQLGALLLVLALVFGAAYFLGISVVARSNFEFDTSDVLSSAAGMWFALFGGLPANLPHQCTERRGVRPKWHGGRMRWRVCSKWATARRSGGPF